MSPENRRRTLTDAEIMAIAEQRAAARLRRLGMTAEEAAELRVEKDAERRKWAPPGEYVQPFECWDD